MLFVELVNFNFAARNLRAFIGSRPMRRSLEKFSAGYLIKDIHSREGFSEMAGMCSRTVRESSGVFENGSEHPESRPRDLGPG